VDSVSGRYRFIARLGSGGSSTVVLAEDTLLGRPVALKRIHTPDDLAARSRLRREALIGASVGHPNLVSVFDVVATEDGDEVIVMEYVDGETLADRLRRGEKLAVPAVLDVLDGVGAALDAIHARGIVHRDVKPANILLGADGEIKLADLGVAAVPETTEMTTTGAVIGTFRFMAPEQLHGARATPAIDIYALAAVAYEALSGVKARLEPNPLALAHAMATQPPPDLRRVWPEAPDAAAELLIRGMSRDPQARPRTAGELAGALRAALAPSPLRPAAVRHQGGRPAPVVAVPRRRRSPGAVAAAAAMLLAAIALAGVVLANPAGGRRELAAAHAGQTRTPAHAASPGSSHSGSGQPTGSHRAKQHSLRPAATTSQPATSASQPGASSTQPAASTSQPGAAAAGSPADTPNSPIDAVEAFYHLAASHQYAAAWALADPSFRQQLEGYGGLAATMAAERAIIFNAADVVDQSPNSATVLVKTTSLQADGTQSCDGTVNVLKAGSDSPGWVLDHIAINCA
jgi:serine/threonine protein kinase